MCVRDDTHVPIEKFHPKAPVSGLDRIRVPGDTRWPQNSGRTAGQFRLRPYLCLAPASADPRASQFVEHVHRLVDLSLGVVEMRREPDPGARPEVDDDVASDERLANGRAVRHVDDYRAAAP